MNVLRMWWVAAVLGSWCVAGGAAEPAAAPKLSFDIPAQSLRDALNDFGRQAGVSIAFYDDAVTDLRTPGLAGKFTRDAALERLLANTRLSYRFVNASTVAIQAAKPTTTDIGYPDAPQGGAARLARLQTGQMQPTAEKKRAGDETDPVDSSGTPEILVEGSRLLNMDIRRTRDDIQPYVVFEREMIQASGAPNVDSFLKQRLTMNTIHLSNSQISDGPSSLGAGNMSAINLRGLGGNQTLILIDGRRTASSMNSSGDATPPYQADLNSIPVSAIERIEVLPTTASGTYGGSATGGVINVILRRDYTGTEFQLTQDDSMRGDAPLQRVEFSFGTSFEEGRTSLLLRGSYSDRDTLHHRDRDLTTRGRERVSDNNPGYFENAFFPPLGATTNIVSADGVELTLKPQYGGTALNAFNTYIPAGFPGVTPANASQLVANAGQYNMNLANSAQNDGGGDSAMITGATVQSFTGTVRREFTDSIQAFLDISVGRNSSRSPQNGIGTVGLFIADSAPNNPFEQSLFVSVPNNDNGIQRVRSDTRRAAAGVIMKLPGKWSGEVDHTWNESVFSLSNLLGDFPDFGVEDGTLNVLRDTNLYPVDYSDYHGIADTRANKSRAVITSLRLSGPVGSLPGGEPILSALIEHRRDAFGISGTSFYTLYGTYVAVEQNQEVSSAYAELNLPLVSERNKKAGIAGLELQIAARTDRYETVTRHTALEEGSPPEPGVRSKLDSTNPTFGLRYRPMSTLMLRASYSTGFQAPTVDQLVTANFPFTFPAGFFRDPRRGNELGRAFLNTSGGNPNLRPEKSKSWSAGAVFTPAVLPGLRMSLDLTHIRKRDNIYTRFGTIPGFQLLVNNEALLPGRITRGAPPVGDPYGVGRIIAMNTTFENLSRAEVEAFDAAIDYHLDIAQLGMLEFYTLATYQPHFKTQILASSPAVDNAGIGSGNPVKVKGNAGVTWSRDRWTAGWSVNFYGTYKVADPRLPTSATTILNQGSVNVSSQDYHDLFAKYVFATKPSFLSELQVQAGVRNLFDTRPPFDAGASTLGYYSPFGDPRLRSYYVTVKTAF